MKKMMTAAVALAGLSMIGCNAPVSKLDTAEMPRSSGRLFVEKQASDIITFAEISYTNFSTGEMKYHGDINFIRPNEGIDTPVTLTGSYKTSAKNISSDLYRGTTRSSNPIEVDRLDVSVVEYESMTNIAKIQARISQERTNLFIDTVYGADRIDAILDLSGPVLKILRVEIVGAWAMDVRRFTVQGILSALDYFGSYGMKKQQLGKGFNNLIIESQSYKDSQKKATSR